MNHIRWNVEAIVLGALFVCAFRFLGAWGGYLEPLCALLFPLLLMEASFRGRPAFYTWLACTLGLIGLLHWVPATLVSKGGLSQPLSLLGGGLFWAYEGAGMMLIVVFARKALRRGGPWAAAACAAFSVLVWERFAFHIYDWGWGAAFGSLPLLARSAAFLSAPGLSALLWAGSAWGAAQLATDRPQRAWMGTASVLGAMLLLGGVWHALPREHERRIDVVVIQPDYPAGVRFPGMLQDLQRRTDEVLATHHLPRPERKTLVLWAESSVLGREHSLADPALTAWVKARGIALLFGTEGGRPAPASAPHDSQRRWDDGWEPGILNLVRGEVDDRPFFTQAKVVPMAFGERMPGPEPMRRWLDRVMEVRSQEPGTLSPDSAFVIPEVTELPGELASVGVQAPRALRVHPLICSEALLPWRAREGAVLSRADLLTNHTNDNWFERSPATYLHVAQIRLRSVELGRPMVRATLGGVSGLFKEDGRFELWSGPRTQGAWAFELGWKPVGTPARSAWLFWILVLGSGAAALVLSWRDRFRKTR
jgi:apolipoprotein N-acyltransferase